MIKVLHPRSISAALMCFLASYIVVGYLNDRFIIGVDDQKETSIPGLRIVLIDKHNTKREKGKPYAFRVRNLQPLYPDGRLFIKYLDGLPGDQVTIDSDVVINGQTKANGIQLAKVLGVKPETFKRTTIVEEGKFFFLGRAYNSLDSRYFGTVSEERILGRAYLVWMDNDV